MAVDHSVSCHPTSSYPNLDILVLLILLPSYPIIPPSVLPIRERARGRPQHSRRQEMYVLWPHHSRRQDMWYWYVLYRSTIILLILLPSYPIIPPFVPPIRERERGRPQHSRRQEMWYVLYQSTVILSRGG